MSWLSIFDIEGILWTTLGICDECLWNLSNIPDKPVLIYGTIELN
jgi:hypothetical protein